MERFPLIFRYRYEPMAQFLMSQFDPCFEQYQNMVNAVDSGAVPPGSMASALQSIAVLEAQLTWMVNMIGAIIGGAAWNATQVDVSLLPAAAAAAWPSRPHHFFIAGRGEHRRELGKQGLLPGAGSRRETGDVERRSAV
jgi:hypothetical protein